MRWLRLVAGVMAAAVVLTVIVVEFAALPLASRSASRMAERCSTVTDLEVSSIRRPAVAGLLRGELRDVRVEAVGVQIGSLVLESLRAELPIVRLVGDGDEPRSMTTVLADVTVTEEALTDHLDAVAPEPASPTVTVTADGLHVGDRRVPFTLDLRISVVDGEIELIPVAGDTRLWQSLGLSLHVRMPARIELQDVRTTDGQVRLRGRAELGSGSGEGPHCPGRDAP